MMPYYYQSDEFENEFVMTKEILLKVFDAELKESKDNPKLDLGYNVPIYNWYTNKRYFIEPSDVLSHTEYVLFNIANAFKYLDDEILTDRLINEANNLRNQSLGSMLNSDSYDYIIKQAVLNKDTRLVEPNTTIRFLKNPYYTKNKTDYKVQINQLLNQEVINKNYQLISDCISDYDLIQKRLTKSILALITGNSLSTIKNYLNNYQELNEMFETIRMNSGTKSQLKNSEYNQNKISKIAKLSKI
jgi:hypothetical protein